MKHVLTSVRPYYVFLIIARQMGWSAWIDKKVEIRKSFPKSVLWDRKVIIYCTKDMKSFNRIPKEYQPLMRPLLGKIVGEFSCNTIVEAPCGKYHKITEGAGLNGSELALYVRGERKVLYGWYISDLTVYKTPKDLSEFQRACNRKEDCGTCKRSIIEKQNCIAGITRPPQSWCYVEVA